MIRKLSFISYDSEVLVTLRYPYEDRIFTPIMIYVRYLPERPRVRLTVRVLFIIYEYFLLIVHFA